MPQGAIAGLHAKYMFSFVNMSNFINILTERELFPRVTVPFYSPTNNL